MEAGLINNLTAVYIFWNSYGHSKKIDLSICQEITDIFRLAILPFFLLKFSTVAIAMLENFNFKKEHNTCPDSAPFIS